MSSIAEYKITKIYVVEAISEYGAMRKVFNPDVDLTTDLTFEALQAEAKVPSWKQALEDLKALFGHNPNENHKV